MPSKLGNALNLWPAWIFFVVSASEHKKSQSTFTEISFSRESKNWTEIHHLKPLLRCFLFDAEFLLLYFCCSNSLVKTYNWNTICAFVRSRHLLANSNSTNLLSKAAKGRGRKGRLDKKKVQKNRHTKNESKTYRYFRKKVNHLSIVVTTFNRLHALYLQFNFVLQQQLGLSGHVCRVFQQVLGRIVGKLSKIPKHNEVRCSLPTAFVNSPNFPEFWNCKPRNKLVGTSCILCTL